MSVTVYPTDADKQTTFKNNSTKKVALIGGPDDCAVTLGADGRTSYSIATTVKIYG